jgi:hypothetical protein
VCPHKERKTSLHAIYYDVSHPLFVHTNNFMIPQLYIAVTHFQAFLDLVFFFKKKKIISIHLLRIGNNSFIEINNLIFLYFELTFFTCASKNSIFFLNIKYK